MEERANIYSAGISFKDESVGKVKKFLSQLKITRKHK